MINLFLVCIVTLSSFAADIDALNKDKEAFKTEKSKKIVKINQHIDEDESRIIIIFNSNDIPIGTIEKNYHLLLEKCLVQKICIFKKEDNNSLQTLIKRMKSELTNVDEINVYKKYHFKRY